MTGPVPIAFYAPLKSPLHPAPSGDRTMARLLLKTLRLAGFEPELASELRTHDRAGDPDLQAQLKRASEQEAQALIARFSELGPAQRPRLWFTYHVYYKAPDWLGPKVAAALRIPYVAAEASRASKRAGGPWALGHAGAEAALDKADMLFVMTQADRVALARHKPPHQRLVDLPPFLDVEDWLRGASRVSAGGESSALRLLTVAMMRQGDKLASYRILGEALAGLTHLPWRLDIVGDGEARAKVEALFADLRERVTLHGAVEEKKILQGLYASSDLFVWPAVNEAYGMVLLEAQALGCPVVAGAYGGVPSVVRDGSTGLLTAPGDARAFAGAVEALIVDANRRRALGENARRFVCEERDLSTAAQILRNALHPLVGASR